MPNKTRAQFLGSHKNKFIESTFCELFHETALTYPDKIAVDSEYDSFTYQVLEEKSNTLAAVLLEKGLRHGEIVGVRAGQTIWSVLCMLAVWKAGGAYTYIDSTHPVKRQNQIIEECEIRFILDTEFLFNIDSTRKDDYIDLSKMDDLALLIYTSGSTSKPKGVMLSQSNVTASISNFTRLDMTEDDVYAVFPSYSFVASVYDIFSSLVIGATISIIPKDIRKSVTELKKYYIEKNVSVTFLPPHMAQKFMAIENDETPLRVMLVGSEMARNLAKKHYHMYNVYGASEMTAMISCYDIIDERKAYPVGTLNENLKGYIVDDDGNPVKDGESGELWLAGRQVGLGYYKDKERTEQHFTKNPFSDEEGYNRIFKTNDLVRLDEEGNLEYLGRKDYLYKIRGFRVEAGAVETAMLSSDKIKEAVAIAFTDSGGTQILCGYFVSDEKIDPKAVKGFLKAKLPYYMIPTAIFQLDEMPRNINNKIDRKAIKPPAELDDYKLLAKLY